MAALNSFNNFNFPHMARGDFMWNGYAVVISPNVPREHIGDEIKPIMPHRFVSWLERMLGNASYPVCFVPGPKIEQDNIYQTHDKLMMRPEMWERLKVMTTGAEGK